MRKLFNKDHDHYVYVDDEYVIFKKWGQTTGTMEYPLFLMEVAIEGLKDLPVNYFYAKDFKEIVNNYCSELQDIATEYERFQNENK